jgi:predicted amidohydrolase YtcJ
MHFTGSIVVKNAQIHTLNPDHPQASALAAVGGRIAALGDEATVRPYEAQADRVIDAGGAAVVPGFIDTHVHFTITGLGMLAVDLADVDSLDEVLGAIRRYADSQPGESLIVASGFQAELNPQKRFPTVAELNEAGGGRPVYVMDRGGHWSAVNPAALTLLGLDADTPGLGKDSTGAFDGMLTGEANHAAFTTLWQVFAEQIGAEKAFARAAQEAVKGGVTTLHALDDLENVRAMLAYQDHLLVRVVPYTQTRDVEAVKALGLKQIGGCGQVAVDGDFGPHTAALLEPYTDEPDTRGKLYFTDEALQDYVMAAHREGLQVALHCVGSGAIEQLITAYDKALAQQPRVDHRHRIEHFELPVPGQAERAKALGLALAMQPAFNHFWPHYDDYPEVVGEERAGRVDPVRSVLDAGLPIAHGSDSPVTPMQPLLSIHSAVNHSNPAERIAVEDALRLVTQSGAWIAFEEADKGSLEVGKLADFVMLGDDPLTAPAGSIKDIAVLLTVVGGEVVYEK